MHEPLIDGATIRKLWICEARTYRDHLLRLDPASRRARFGAAMSEDVIRRYVDDSICAEAVIHGCFSRGVLRGAAEMRPVGAAPTGEAEVALSIEEAWQGCGIGTALLDRILLSARNRGITRLHMSCLAENRRMQQLALKFDAALSFDFGSVIGEVESPHPTPMSVMRELLVEGHGVAAAMLEVQSRLLGVGER